jgi:DNA-directed RNA polymerase beta subunit
MITAFLISPYRVVKNAKVTDEVVWLRADEEASGMVCPADTLVENGMIAEERVLARTKSDVVWIDRNEVQYIDVAPCQMVGVSAGLIPFLEHDDANRALMGSNMQRQAVPLLISSVLWSAPGWSSCCSEFRDGSAGREVRQRSRTLMRTTSRSTVDDIRCGSSRG